MATRVVLVFALLCCSSVAAWDILSSPVTDGHIHLVDPKQGFPYTWTPLVTCQQDCAVCTGIPGDCNVYRSWTVQDYQMTQIYNVTKLVFMEVSTACSVSQPIGVAEARWVQQLSATQPLIKGIVGKCTLQAGDAIEPCLAEISAIPLVRGIRSDFTLNANGTGLDPDFVRGVALLAKYNLSYDLISSPTVVTYVYELAAQTPEVTFIVDHLGGPVIANASTMPAWMEGMGKLATLSNVYVKISGGPQNSGTPLWTIDMVKPYVTFLIEKFGVERCLYSGNWFWVNNYSNLGRWSLGLWEIVRPMLNDQQLESLYSGTADKVYRL